MSLVSSNDNKTWTVGGWRLYVAFELTGWRWNLRNVEWGWEIKGDEDFREDAIMTALDTAEAIDSQSPAAHRGYMLLVNGSPASISVLPTAPLSDVLQQALIETEYTQFQNWEVRMQNGFLCEQHMPIQVFFSHQSEPLSVTLPAGVGG